MTDTLVLAYVAGWIVTAVGMYVFAKRFGDELRPASHALAWSVLGSVFWPVVLFGAIQMTAIALLVDVAPDDEDWFTPPDDIEAPLLEPV